MKLDRQKPKHVKYKVDPENISGNGPARHAAKQGFGSGTFRKEEEPLENEAPAQETPAPVVAEPAVPQQTPEEQPSPVVSELDMKSEPDGSAQPEQKPGTERPAAAPTGPEKMDAQVGQFSWKDMAPDAEQGQPDSAETQAEQEDEPQRSVRRRRRWKSSHSSKPRAFKSFQEFLDRTLSIKFLYEVFRNRLRTLFIVGVVCSLLFMCVQTFIKSFTAGVTMSLNYEESVTGKTPNGARFSESEFLTQEYLEAILQATGLQDELTTADLADCISITPTTSRLVTAEDDYYISSSYNLTFQLPWSLWHKITAKDFLNEICRVYNQRFTADYRTNATSLDVSYDYSDMDYSEIGSYFQMMANRINNYLIVRNDQAGSYLSSTGQSYSAVKKQVQNLQNYTLAEYQSYIWENGVAKDNARCIDDINASIRTLRWSERSDSEKSSVYMKILEDYNNKMVSSVLIPTYDSDGAFYMSRTKIGIDDLALQANDLLTSAVDEQKSIATNNSKITALQEPTTEDELRVAQSMVDNITQQLKDIVSATRELDADCYAQRISSYLVFSTPYVPLMSRYSVKSSVVLAAGVCCIWYLAAVVQTSSEDQRKRKRDEKE